MIEVERAARYKETMAGAAFVGWQLGAGEKGMSFARYLRKLGLSDDPPPLTPEQRKKIAAQALQTADKINAAFKAGKVT